jgi:hypothetical protein
MDPKGPEGMECPVSEPVQSFDEMFICFLPL